jgi:hypothetical protein
MEDGPEEAEGRFDYNGRTYRLEEFESEKWKIYGDGVYLGQVVAVDGVDGPEYTIDLAGEEGKVDEPSTDDWRRAVETLIDLAG